MRVRIVLALAVCAVLGLLVRTLLGDAPAVVATNRVAPGVFAVIVPPGRTACQFTPPPPPEASIARLTIGTFGRPVPTTRIAFRSRTGAAVITGESAGGGPEGVISIPLTQLPGAPPPTTFCLSFGAPTRVALGGERGPPGPADAQIDGRPQAGAISVTYERARPQSWWSRLASLPARFGRGKAGFLAGEWALPACVLALAAAWAAAIRLLARELR